MTHTIGAIAAPRCCGTREKGGLYWELGLTAGDGGVPVEKFLIDAPFRFPEDKIQKRGVTPWIRDGVLHLIDWVGEENYPNVADFVEEARRLGVSRRMPVGLTVEMPDGTRRDAYSMLTAESRLVLMHRRAWIANEDDVRDLLKPEDPHHACPHRAMAHQIGQSPQCLGTSWEVVTDWVAPTRTAHAELDRAEASQLGGSKAMQGYAIQLRQGIRRGYALNHRLVERQLPSFSYLAWRAPDDFEPAWESALFMSVPCTRLVVVNDPETERHLRVLEKMQDVSLPLEIVDA